MTDSLRFVFTTDIHFGFDRKNKVGSHAAAILKDVVDHTHAQPVDLVLDGGDRIIYQNPNDDLRFLKELKTHFNRFAAPIHSANGNHDIGNLTPEQNAQILGRPAGSYSFDVQGWHICIFNPDLDIEFSKAMHIRDSSLDWLRRDLAANDKPVIFITHVPPDNLDADTLHSKEMGKYIPSVCDNGPDLRRILEDDGRTQFCLSGHVHKNKLRTLWRDRIVSEGDGITYITHQSLTERDYVTGEPLQAWSRFEAAGAQVRVTGFGMNQPSYVLRLKG